MRRFAWLLIALALAVPRPASAQGINDLPHAFLFGAWTGGLFPPPTTLSGRECLANPTIIFTRDTVMRATITDVSYRQSLVETVRDTGRGVDFRFLAGAPPAAPSGGMFSFSPMADADLGFGCDDPTILRVQRRGEREIIFPNCTEFPYPLLRCPGG